MLLILLLLPLFYFPSTCISVSTDQAVPSFRQSATQYDKNYDSEGERNKRQKTYASNVEKLGEKNFESSTGNYFPDWTTEQTERIYAFKLDLMTLKLSGKQQKIASIQKQSQRILEQSQRILEQSVPLAFDWRNTSSITSVKNTGYCGASWAFSTVAFFQQLAIIAGTANSTLDLSETYLMSCNPQNQRCSAGYIESSIDLVIDGGGLPLEAKYPYNLSVMLSANTCLETEFFQVKNQARMSYFRVTDPSVIKRIIFKKPVIAAVCATDFLAYSPQSSRTLKCKPQNRIIDHSVLLVGYTETEWIVKNHWGTDWGVDGYGYISRNPSEDCCIGEQIHSSGAITPTCSVQYCQTCVETDTCYKCETGRWVKHNTITGVQTCEPCSQPNCTECYNYMGTCKWCADGFGLNSTTGKCTNATIANCNLLESGICNQCKPGHRLASIRNACNVFCTVKNCIKCPIGPCSECRAGFSLINVPFNNQTVQFCSINNCSVANCTLCNSSGACVTCASSFTLQPNGTCTTNCTSIPFCVSCMLGSTACSECIEGQSYNSSKRACEVFNLTANCRVHRTTCSFCRTGHALASGRCIQICESVGCSTCVTSDISYCLTCADGYFLNRTTVYSVCTKHPCNVGGCLLCDSSGKCISCMNKFDVFNATANRCENQCALQNCRDCLPNATVCSFCNRGYAVDSASKLCIPSNLSNCASVYTSKEGELLCFTCQTKYYLARTPSNKCLIWCTDQFCQECQPDSLHVCQKCTNGYSQVIINGMATCKLIPSTMTGCERISLNQSYCFACSSYHVRNQKTGVCEKNTANCPQMCEHCTVSTAAYFGCRCHSGFVFELDTKQCVKTPFNDTNCLMIQFQYTDFFCLQCPKGMVLNAAWNGCDSSCLIPECTTCAAYDNLQCALCNEGFYLGPNGFSCVKCPFANCSKCTLAKCIDCGIGFELSSNGMNCTEILCKTGFVYDGYACACPSGAYQDADVCKFCDTSNCVECNQYECLRCQSGYFLENDQCKKCPSNCKTCTSSTQCLECNHLYFLSQSLCIFLNSQTALYHTDSSIVLECQTNCLQCDSFGNCLKCPPTTANYIGVCINCIQFCRTCLFRNTSFCISCEPGFFLDSNTCIICIQANCLDCPTSPSICTSCKEGFYLLNSTCQPCTDQNCLACNFNAHCTRCSSGFTLLSNHSCEQCAGNCRQCNSNAINECFVACNTTSYEFQGQCYSCPIECKTCASSLICLSCSSGYQMKNHTCQKPCSDQGCFKCQTQNVSLCQECFSGYLLTQNATCEPDLSCNTNQSCTLCPKKWTLLQNKCQLCNLSSQCTQCAIGNVSLCIQCQSGFFASNSQCLQCSLNCIKCISFEKCSQCRDGFFLPKESIEANCATCDSNCKTCEHFSTKCITCNDGFELSVAQRCLNIQKINATVQLNLQFERFPTFSRQIRSDLIGLMGDEHRNEQKLYIITDLRSGSVILSFYLAIPEGKGPQEMFASFQTKIMKTPSIGGIELIAIKRLQLVDSTKEKTQQEVVIEKEQTSKQINNNLAIILGVVIPSVVIILVIVGCVVKKRLSKPSNVVENTTDQVLDQTKEEFQIHRKKKLPPIAHHTHLTPPKDGSMGQFDSTGNYDTFLITPQQQSYEQFYENNEETKPELVRGFDLEAEDHQRINNMDLGKIRQDPSFIHQNNYQKVKENGETQGNKGKKLDQQNDVVQEIEFVDDTLRQMNQGQHQIVVPADTINETE